MEVFIEAGIDVVRTWMSSNATTNSEKDMYQFFVPNGASIRFALTIAESARDALF